MRQAWDAARREESKRRDAVGRCRGRWALGAGAGAGAARKALEVAGAPAVVVTTHSGKVRAEGEQVGGRGAGRSQSRCRLGEVIAKESRRAGGSRAP